MEKGEAVERAEVATLRPVGERLPSERRQPTPRRAERYDPRRSLPVRSGGSLPPRARSAPCAPTNVTPRSTSTLGRTHASLGSGRVVRRRSCVGILAMGPPPSPPPLHATYSRASSWDVRITTHDDSAVRVSPTGLGRLIRPRFSRSRQSGSEAPEEVRHRCVPLFQRGYESPFSEIHTRRRPGHDQHRGTISRCPPLQALTSRGPWNHQPPSARCWLSKHSTDRGWSGRSTRAPATTTCASSTPVGASSSCGDTGENRDPERVRFPDPLPAAPPGAWLPDRTRGQLESRRSPSCWTGDGLPWTLFGVRRRRTLRLLAARTGAGSGTSPRRAPRPGPIASPAPPRPPCWRTTCAASSPRRARSWVNSAPRSVTRRWNVNYGTSADGSRRSRCRSLPGASMRFRPAGCTTTTTGATRSSGATGWSALLDFDKLERGPRASDIGPRGSQLRTRAPGLPRATPALRARFPPTGNRERRAIAREELAAMPALAELSEAPFVAICRMREANGEDPATAIRRDLQYMRETEDQGAALRRILA